ncbi:MAG TPA: hypothetical protein VGD35_01490 [Chitinophaga sp.]
MKIVRIFVSEKSYEGLWSIQFDGESKNEFQKFFNLMDDIEWLHNFFVNNKADLYSGYFGQVTIDSAGVRTMDEAEEMEDTLNDYLKMGFAGSDNLQHFFKPLNNFEYVITVHQKSKARIRNGWLRLYAIRLAENCFLVTGGAIKLTADMKRTHLRRELTKLEQAKAFLRENRIEYPEDLNTYLHGCHI